jgi:TRAP-type C4-dicarboxylate transport system substrate-binding protein|tara:strand:- start:2002 stop:2895 length:894 start_codon:yes stop_codon:yes gene_type:complete
LKKTIKLAGYQGHQSIHTQAMKSFINNIDNSFDIDFMMDVTLKGEMASSLIEKTINEDIHISYLWSSYYEKIIPEIKLLDLPYLFKDRNSAYKTLDKKFFNYINEKMNNNNLTLLGFWDNGVRHLSSKVKEIKAPEDCKNQIIRTTPSQLHIDIFKSMGFIPSPLDVRDFKIAVKDGKIDAQENPLTNYWNFEIYKTQKFVSLTNHMIGFCIFAINTNFLNNLSDQERSIIEKSAENSVVFQRNLASKEDGILLNKMEKENVKVTKLSLSQLTEFKKTTQKYHDLFFKEFPLMKEFI